VKEINTTLRNEDSTSAPWMRCIVEIIGGEIAIYPIADTDANEKTILDALRFVIADGVGR